VGILGVEVSEQVRSGIAASVVDEDELVGEARAGEGAGETPVQLRQALRLLEEGHDDAELRGRMPVGPAGPGFC
jgi:hypothetical protein